MMAFEAIAVLKHEVPDFAMTSADLARIQPRIQSEFHEEQVGDFRDVADGRGVTSGDVCEHAIALVP
jgi:hypothetical protein